MENNNKPIYMKIGLTGESSYTFVIPKAFAKQLDIGKGDYVRVMLEENKIKIEKAEAKTLVD